jgi:hypothetical protein
MCDGFCAWLHLLGITFSDSPLLFASFCSFLLVSPISFWGYATAALPSANWCSFALFTCWLIIVIEDSGKVQAQVLV